MHELRDEDPAQLALRVLQLDSQLSEERIRSHQLQSTLNQEQIQLRECRSSLSTMTDDLRKAQRLLQDKDKEVERLVSQLQDVVLSNRREMDQRNNDGSGGTNSSAFRGQDTKKTRGEDRWIQCDLMLAQNQTLEDDLRALGEANEELRQRIAELERSGAGNCDAGVDDGVYTDDSGDLSGEALEEGYRPEPPKFKLNFNIPLAVHCTDEDAGQGSFAASMEETPRVGSVCLKVNQQINIQHMMSAVSQRQLTAREYNTKHHLQTPRALPTPRASGVIRIPFGTSTNAGSHVEPGDSSYAQRTTDFHKRSSDQELLSLQRQTTAQTTSSGAFGTDDAAPEAAPPGGSLSRKDTAQPNDWGKQARGRNDVRSNSVAADGTPQQPLISFVGMPSNLPEGDGDEGASLDGREKDIQSHAAVVPRGGTPAKQQQEERDAGSEPQRRPSQGVSRAGARNSSLAPGTVDSPEPASPDLDLVRLRFMEEASVDGSPRSLFSVERDVDASRCLVCELIDYIQHTYSGKMKSRAAYYAVGWLPEICQRWQLEHSLVWTIEERATVATTLQNRPQLSSFTHWHYEGPVKVHRPKKFIWSSPWADGYALLQGIFLYIFDAKAPKQRVASVISVRGALIEMITCDSKAPHCLRISALGCRTCAGASEFDGVDEIVLRFDTAQQLSKCRQALCTMQMTCPHQCSAKFAQEVESFKEIAELLLSMSLREERDNKKVDSKRKHRSVQDAVTR
jgi:hypothetical protein